MLQTSETSRRIRRQPPIMSPRKEPASKPLVSKLDQLITDLRAAHRQAMSARAEIDSFCEENPNLVPDCEPILIYINGDGEKVFGNSWEDINQVFPESNDHFSSGNKKRRQDLEEALRAAWAKRRDERRKAGFTQARRVKFDAEYARKLRFVAICRYRPQTLDEARKMAQIVRAFLPRIADDYHGSNHNIYGQAATYERLEGWRQARVEAFGFMSTLLLTFASGR